MVCLGFFVVVLVFVCVVSFVNVVDLVGLVNNFYRKLCFNVEKIICDSIYRMYEKKGNIVIFFI